MTRAFSAEVIFGPYSRGLRQADPEQSAVGAKHVPSEV